VGPQLQQGRARGGSVSTRGWLGPPFSPEARELIAKQIDAATEAAATPPARDPTTGKLAEPLRARRWTLPKLLQWATDHLGITCARETLRKVLRGLKVTWKKGKLLLARASAEAREDFVTKIKSLLRAAHAGKEKLIFIDEAHIHQEADLGYTWARKGQRYYVSSTSPGLARVTFFGAYVYNDATIAITPADRANAATTIELLEYARAAFPDDKIRICWDGASYHRAEDVVERARELRILLTPLPAYSPDFMPVEALWRWMREEVTYNHCHATAADLIAGVSTFETKVNQEPQIIFDRLNVRTKLDFTLEKLRVT
jgi:transposase